TGWTTDGNRFDSSRERSAPATFGLQQVIAGWTEGLQLMSNGDHYRFWIPEELAYGGRPGKPAGMLVFDVELISYVSPPKPPEAPADVAAAPEDAQKTASGLAYKVLKKGAGGAKPSAKAMAVVHYAGWTTDGKNFDFSRKRGDEPAAFGVGGVIPGWTEGLQLMEKGDSYRFWIPPDLAYEGKRGPQGTLVFDVELLDVVEPPPLTVPADAVKTESGLQYTLITANPGGMQAPEGSKLQMNWVGCVAEDGAGFDSNLGKAPAHPVGQMRAIEGLVEAAKILHVGEKGRFFIPESLAFKGRPGAPKGMLVYDLELVGFDAPAGSGHPGGAPH
ncbi:MAG: FKBP-type peptidyl-prolyl cis-trans isomerase, partial [Myxococcales bacterium]|nr:FKBP-type peptidyl-prolyl cis-trans isomerase [Myxococcales bacterium]